MEKAVHTLEELATEAALFAHSRKSKPDAAYLVTLSGELGAGKTAFTKAAARSLGVTEDLTSPTFVLMKAYPLPNESNGFKRLVHVDAYRLESGAELAPVRFSELAADPENLIFLEWPEKVADALPPADASIRIMPEADGTRTLAYG